MDNLSILWIVLLPLAGAIINGVGARVGVAKSWITTIAVGSVLGAFGLAVHNFIKLWELKHGVDGIGGVEDAKLVADVYEWFSISLSSGSGGFREIPIHVRFVFDSLSGLMTLVVTGIGSLIHIYSVEYMSEERSYARFFAYLNLFTASMLVLVLASNFPLMFVGWEGVGVCSYLLIGFWFETPAYAAAGRKAFVANRVGDFGVLIGMFTLVMLAGSFEFDAINAAAPELARPMMMGGAPLTISMATFACLFLFLGCTGKSAQLPLYVWLPDAMAGPTPVSALIHAATMVTAGVYLCCRLSPVFLESPTALGVIALVGAATAFLGATIAVVQREMKKILAYSTVSQLGFMFAAVGVGAFSAGFFHVFTHAFFKACLFLGAGAVMHAVHAHGDADIFKLGGLAQKLPVVRWTFLISCLAIAGVPMFSGFFSKDEILLGATTIAMLDGLPIAPWIGWVVAITLTIAATLTAFYMFRLYYLTFTGTYRSAKDEGDAHDDHAHDDHAHDDHGDHGHGYDPHPHGPHFPIKLALGVLGFGALVVGYLGLPHHFAPNWWHHWMEPSIAGLALTEEQSHAMGPVWAAMAMGLFAMAAGVGAATVIYRGKNDDTFTPKLPKRLFDFLFDKWRVDELYDATIIRLNKAVAMLAGRVDKSFVDGVLTGLPAKAVALGGHLFSRLQVGVVHAYGLVLVIGLAGVSWWFLYPHADVEVEATGESATLTAGRGMGYEYRFDLDGDGQFDVPTQPTRVTIDLADDATDAQVFRVAALVRAAIAPVQWPADRAALGRLVSRGGKIYELTPPVAELPDLEAALERAEGVESVRFVRIGSEARFAREARAEASYDADDYATDAAVLLVATREGPVPVSLSARPRQLDFTLLFGPAGMPQREEVEGAERSTLPPYAWVEDGKIVIRPNAVAAVVAGEGAQERIELSYGESTRLGLAAVRAVPVVRATVEVRNAFGNVASETVDVVLDASTSEAHAALRLNPESVR